MAPPPATAGATRPVAPEGAPRRRETTKPPLAAVSGRELRRRRERRQSRVLLALAGAAVAGSLLVVAAAQAVVASQQLRIDGIQQQLSSAVTENGNLELRRAELDAPARILQLAQHQLGMVTPASVTYLVPVTVGPTVGSAPASGKS